MLGVGDFYYELGVQIIEVCLALKHRNGGEDLALGDPEMAILPLLAPESLVTATAISQLYWFLQQSSSSALFRYQTITHSILGKKQESVTGLKEYEAGELLL